jgi:hypothetical protein
MSTVFYRLNQKLPPKLQRWKLTQAGFIPHLLPNIINTIVPIIIGHINGTIKPKSVAKVVLNFETNGNDNTITIGSPQQITI